MALPAHLQSLVKNAKNKYSRSTGRTVKPKEGKTRVRILPGIRSDGKFWADLAVHWIKTEINGKPVAVVGCHDGVYDAPCPVCTMIEKAITTAPDDESVALYKSWKARGTVLVNALVRSGEDKSEDPVILELTRTAFGNILSMIEEYEADYGYVLDPTSGMDFTIERKGKGIDTEYSVMPNPKSEPVSKASLSKQVDLDEYIQKEFFKGDEAKAISHISNMTGITHKGITALPSGRAGLLASKGASVADDVSEFDEPTPVVKKAAPKAAAKPAPKVEEADTDDLDDVLAGLDDLE